MQKIRPIIGIVLSCLILMVCLIPQVQTIILLPESQKMVVGEANTIKLDLPQVLKEKIDMQVMENSRSVFAAQEDPAVVVSKCNSGYEIVALKPGKVNVKVNILGYIPIKSIAIESMPTRRLVVGGHSIGVVMKSRGIMVVGHAGVAGEDGNKVYPGREKGIEIGDLIFSVNGKMIDTETDLARVIDEKKGETIEIGIKRHGKRLDLNLKPVYCSETDRYRVGLYVRDGVVGVGTLTFWDPETKEYAALGHIIVDADTKQRIDVLKGKVVSASIQTIKPGRPGRPGEKIGIFNENGPVEGNILKNSYYGIYGKTEEKISNPLTDYTMEVAYTHQVKTGKAYILTVVNGDDIEKFDVEIEKVFPQRQNGKGMVIKVTDPRLINLSGGIVQGMSGSPIIQDNKIVGAVTHVFLNNPEMGYGIFIDNMLSELISQPQDLKNISTNS